MRPASIWDWVGPFALMAIFIAYLHLSTPSEIVLCKGNDDCFREWVSAMSGWVAAAGALYAAHLTLRPLLRQVEEARRQTDYIIGDAEPEFVLLRNRRKNTMNLRAINWNRRVIVVENITCVSPQDITVSRYWAKDDVQPKEKKDPHYRIDGWYDRTLTPPKRYFLLTFSNGDGPISDYARSGRAVSVEIAYRIAGQVHERRKSIASALDIYEDD